MAITLDFQKNNIKLIQIKAVKIFLCIFFFNLKMTLAANIERPQLAFKAGLKKKIFLERRHIKKKECPREVILTKVPAIRKRITPRKAKRN